MRELFNHQDNDGDSLRVLRGPGRSGWYVRVVRRDEVAPTAHLDRAALELLSAALLAELKGTPGTPPEGPAGASTANTSERDCVCHRASTRRAQALVSASRVAPAGTDSAAVIGVAQDFERYLEDGTVPVLPEPACTACGHDHVPGRVCLDTVAHESGDATVCECRAPRPPVPGVTVNDSEPEWCRCGHQAHGNTACGRVAYATQGPVKCRCQGPDRPVAAINPAGCGECGHEHVRGLMCRTFITNPSGTRVSCGCTQ